MFDQAIGLPDELMPLVGEFAWHSLTVDPRISAESEAHLAEVERVLDAYPLAGDPMRLLEVGAYAHTTGYTLAERRGADVTLLDVSASTLRLGREIAAPTTATPTLVAADFHELPFEDESFDAVVIRSSVHHTWRWRRVIDQMLRVLNTGGILFLENEPVHRSCCLYLFRANREEKFTPFEQSLNTHGALRTFAEPYLGSRPETLFGMVENQTIPLNELLDAISGKADLVETTLVPEHTMGELEHSWVRQMGEPQHELAASIRADLTRARHSERCVRRAGAGVGVLASRRRGNRRPGGACRRRAAGSADPLGGSAVSRPLVGHLRGQHASYRSQAGNSESRLTGPTVGVVSGSRRRRVRLSRPDGSATGRSRVGDP